MFIYIDVNAQEKTNEIGISYYGELGLNPGVEIDYGSTLSQWSKEKNKRSVQQQINFRPSLSYYNLPKYTNNYIIASSLNYQFRLVKKDSDKYWYLEPFLKIGYLRYSYIGDIFETDDNGNIQETNFRGGNSFVFGSGLNVGGSLKVDRMDWLIGTEYLPELTDDKLFINHVIFKLGIRRKI